MCPRSGFRSGGTSECTLVPVFVPGEHPPKPPFWKTHPFVKPRIIISEIIPHVEVIDCDGIFRLSWVIVMRIMTTNGVLGQHAGHCQCRAYA